MAQLISSADGQPYPSKRKRPHKPGRPSQFRKGGEHEPHSNGFCEDKRSVTISTG
jgi:hypothetical protein